MTSAQFSTGTKWTISDRSRSNRNPFQVDAETHVPVVVRGICDQGSGVWCGPIRNKSGKDLNTIVPPDTLFSTTVRQGFTFPKDGSIDYFIDRKSFKKPDTVDRIRIMIALQRIGLPIVVFVTKKQPIENRMIVELADGDTIKITEASSSEEDPNPMIDVHEMLVMSGANGVESDLQYTIDPIFADMFVRMIVEEGKRVVVQVARIRKIYLLYVLQANYVAQRMTIPMIAEAIQKLEIYEKNFENSDVQKQKIVKSIEKNMAFWGMTNNLVQDWFLETPLIAFEDPKKFFSDFGVLIPFMSNKTDQFDDHWGNLKLDQFWEPMEVPTRKAADLDVTLEPIAGERVIREMLRPFKEPFYGATGERHHLFANTFHSMPLPVQQGIRDILDQSDESWWFMKDLKLICKYGAIGTRYGPRVHYPMLVSSSLMKTPIYVQNEINEWEVLFGLMKSSMKAFEQKWNELIEKWDTFYTTFDEQFQANQVDQVMSSVTDTNDQTTAQNVHKVQQNADVPKNVPSQNEMIQFLQMLKNVHGIMGDAEFEKFTKKVQSTDKFEVVVHTGGIHEIVHQKVVPKPTPNASSSSSSSATGSLKNDEINEAKRSKTESSE